MWTYNADQLTLVNNSGSCQQSYLKFDQPSNMLRGLIRKFVNYPTGRYMSIVDNIVYPDCEKFQNGIFLIFIWQQWKSDRSIVFPATWPQMWILKFIKIRASWFMDENIQITWAQDYFFNLKFANFQKLVKFYSSNFVTNQDDWPVKKCSGVWLWKCW